MKRQSRSTRIGEIAEAAARAADGDFPAPIDTSDERDPLHALAEAVNSLIERGRKTAAERREEIDNSERGHAEKRIRHLGKLYAVLSQVNQAIAKITDRNALFQAICRTTVEYGEFCMAWIGLVDEESGLVRPVAHAGQGADYLEKTRIETGDGADGQGPTGTSIREGRLVICDDIVNDPRMEPWREEALARGFRSSVAVPFRTKGRVIGALSLYAGESGLLDDEVRRLLEEIGTDITFALDALASEQERRHAEEELGLRAHIIGQCPYAIIATDLDGNITSWNRGAERIYGYSAEEAIGRHISILYFEEDFGLLQHSVIDPLMATGLLEIEVPVRRCSGERIVVLLSLWLLADSSGRPFGMVGYSLDVSPRKQAEDQLRERKVLIETILENAPIGFAINTIHDGKGVFVSSKFHEIYGLPRHSGNTVDEFFERVYLDPAFREEMQARIMSDIASGDASRMRWENIPITTSTGEKKVVTAMNIPLPEQDLMISAVQDVTERWRLEGQLFQAQKMETVGRLAGGVAHDFNNMLTVILGYVEMVRSSLPKNDERQEDLAEVESAANCSRDIIRQLLAFSRKQIIAPAILDLNDVIDEMKKALMRLIGEDIELSFRPGEGLWRVHFDRTQLDQVLINLAVNSRDAMPGGGKLTIETTNVEIGEDYCRRHPEAAPGEYVMLTVSDNGIGMSAEVLAHVFEPFFTTKDIGRGTGLGLSTVYGIVKQNRGFINVSSEPGHGTSFMIYLPGISKAAEPEEPAEEILELEGTGTVLLVEDDPMVRKLTTSMLTSMGYEVLASAVPSEALRICLESKTPIDLLITDVVMPGMNGKELRDKVEVFYSGIRVLFMSGYTANVIAHHGVLEEGVHYVQKPFSKNDLARKVREVLARK
jgi:PAS domain S-box-containing protein